MTVWPNGSKTIPRVSSEFGARAPIKTPNGNVTRSFHYGIDLVGFPTNKSPADGVVIFAAYNGGAGNQISIRADNGDVFVIMHNARFLVSKGQRVSEGQSVGVMGTTGNSTGVHCHFETRPRGGAAVNPRGYMAAAIPAGLKPTPIPATPKPQEDDVDFRYFTRTNPTTKKSEWAITHPLFFENGVLITDDLSLANGFAPYTGNSGALTDDRWAGMLKIAKIASDGAWAAEARKAALINRAASGDPAVPLGEFEFTGTAKPKP